MFFFGGADGTRTRDLRRDRPEVAGTSFALAPATAFAAPLPPFVPYVPESPAKRRRRLAARRPSGESLQESPESARRKRPDGIREATLGYLELGYQRFVPFLRLRGHWLASLGFKTRTRVYIEASEGCLVITVKDPAKAKKVAQSPAEQPGTVAELIAARVTRRQRVSRTAAANRPVVRPPILASPSGLVASSLTGYWGDLRYNVIKVERM